MATKAGKTVADFRERHDPSHIIPKRIAAALASLGSGWEYEAEFLAIAKVANNQIGAYREKFADHWLEIRDTSGSGHTRTRRVWCGTKKLRDELLEMTANV